MSESEGKGAKKFASVFLEEISKSPLTVTVLAIFTGLLLGGLLVVVTSEEVYAAARVSVWEMLRVGWDAAWRTYKALFIGSIGDPAKIAAAFQSGEAEAIRRAINPFFESLVKSTPYIFAGLAVALGFRVGLFNIGAEGQLFVGAITAVSAALYIKGLPSILHVPLALLAGFLGGGLWGFIPGWLKAKTGGHEVINTIMMNYIAFRLSEYLLRGPLKDPEGYNPVTAQIPDSAKLMRFFDNPIRFHIGFFIALLFAYLVYLLLFKTTWGFALRTVGANPRAARYAGMDIVKSTVVAMFLSGGLAGLAGANEVLGVNHNLALAFSSGYGFDAIALALLGKSHPLGVVLASILFGFLRNGAVQMQLTAGIPIDIISILQAAILAFIAAPAIIRSLYRLKEPEHDLEAVTLRGWGGN
ncbi:MAG: ABC transporter permease [Anaerolineae bacterium]|nr:MAG: ABC transporter permease [Anaerolineae bacterium]